MAEQQPEQQKKTVDQPAAAGGADGTAEHMAEAALQSADRAARSLESEVGDEGGAGGGGREEPRRFRPPDFGKGDDGRAGVAPAALSLLGDVDLEVKIELGRTRMYVEDVLRLNEHSVVELDRAAGDPVDIYVNDRLIARGEVLVLDENFCVRVSELVHEGIEEAKADA